MYRQVIFSFVKGDSSVIISGMCNSFVIHKEGIRRVWEGVGQAGTQAGTNERMNESKFRACFNLNVG